MTMKNFFTLVALLFLGVVSSVIIAGYISHDNRIAKETYSQSLEQQVKQITSSVDESEKKLTLLEEKFNEASSSLSKPLTTKKTTSKNPTTTTTKTGASSGTVLTAGVVAKHATASDCWIIVSGKVYAVSSYLSMHPGGRTVIVNLCGKDATKAFTTKGGGGTHSSSAWTLLGQFLIGALGATVKL